MNFLKSTFIRRAPFALAAVAALGFAMTDAALATPLQKLGDPCTIHSGPLKGRPGVFKIDYFGNPHKLVCVPTPTRFPIR